MIGNPDSWDLTISFSGKINYRHSTWSPCGRFIAARTEEIVEIRNQLTFQLLAILQSPENTSIRLLKGPLAYSPDGRSLACGFPDGIVIWDIQTGGVARSIDCLSDICRLVWSLDGQTIASTLRHSDNFSCVQTYDVASSVQLSKQTLEKEQVFDLWACKDSFRFVSKRLFSSDSDPKWSISEIGPTRTRIEQLPVISSPPVLIVFSPSTSRISLSDPTTLRILDARNSHRLLIERNSQSFTCFSPDASLFAAPHENGFRVWKYTSNSYISLGRYSLPHIPSLSPHELFIQFSPSSTSILSWCRNVLQVWHLHGSPTTPETSRQHVAISRSGQYIAIAYQSKSAVTIINFHSQAPCQFIDTGVEIEGLVITGNVLLVAFSEKVVGWLLTEEGRVDGVANNRRAGCSDSIWTVTSPFKRPKLLTFNVLGQVGMIGADRTFPFIYHIGTGGVPDRVYQPQEFSLPWVSFYKQSDFKEYHHLRHHDTPRSDARSEDRWLTSRTTTGKAGWVVDPEGRHRFWVPVEWRAPWDPKNCHHDISTLFTRIGDQPVIIKFR